MYRLHVVLTSILDNLAFHAGPRVCLGQNLATLEALVAIIFLLRKYKFSLMKGQDITYQISLTLPMMHGLKVMVEKRLQCFSLK